MEPLSAVAAASHSAAFADRSGTLELLQPSDKLVDVAFIFLWQNHTR